MKVCFQGNYWFLLKNNIYVGFSKFSNSFIEVGLTCKYTYLNCTVKFWYVYTCEAITTVKLMKMSITLRSVSCVSPSEVFLVCLSGLLSRFIWKYSLPQVYLLCSISSECTLSVLYQWIPAPVLYFSAPHPLWTPSKCIFSVSLVLHWFLIVA